MSLQRHRRQNLTILKRWSAVLLLTMTLLLTALASGCQKDKTTQIAYDDIREIRIITGSLKAQYEVDEALDFGNIFIQVVSKSSDVTQRVAVSSGMLRGFDTSTTGKQKEIIITYKGYTVTWLYDVIAGSKKIITSARLTAVRTVDNDFAKVTVTIDIGDFTSPIKAVQFTVSYDDSKYTLNSKVGSYRALLPNWSIVRDQAAMTNKPVFITYPDIKTNGDKGNDIIADYDIAEISFGNQNNGSGVMRLIDITISDGENDIALPDFDIE